MSTNATKATKAKSTKTRGKNGDGQGAGCEERRLPPLRIEVRRLDQVELRTVPPPNAAALLDHAKRRNDELAQALGDLGDALTAEVARSALLVGDMVSRVRRAAVQIGTQAAASDAAGQSACVGEA